MQEAVSLLKEEHIKMKEMFLEIERFINGGSSVDYRKFGHHFKRLDEIWENHEKREDALIKEYAKKNNLIPEKSLSEKHRQLRGYWNSIRRALDAKDCEKLAMVLDTDGRMLLERFAFCIDSEEKFFEGIN